VGSIEVININKHTPNDGVYFYIGRNRENNILGNPYSTKTGTLAQYTVSDRETAIAKYQEYFLENYENNPTFREKIDEIYDMYIRGENICLGCFCAPKSCHGDIIKKHIEMKYLKQFIKKENG